MGECVCVQRGTDMAAGRLVPAAPLGGWVYLDEPLRHMGAHAKLVAHRLNGPGYTDHSGEPFVWTSCRHCGGLLPRVVRSDMEVWGGE
jgi:hypothetical protein